MFGLPQDINSFLNFLFIVSRVSGIMFTAPVFGSSVVDVRLRMFFSFILGYILYPFVNEVVIADVDILLWFLLIIKEILIGIAMGLMGQFIFAGVQFGGQLIGFQMGFAVVDIIDPSSNIQASIIAQFQNILMILIFLSINGHLLLINTIAKSFEMVHLATFVFPVGSFFYIVELFSKIFFIAIKIVAPVFVTLLITNIVMGIIGRLVPQINLLIVGFPLQIAIGLVMLMLSLQFFYVVFEKVVQNFFENILSLFSMLGG
jgi:flagellar biosynthetic protein FliR